MNICRSLEIIISFLIFSILDYCSVYLEFIEVIFLIFSLLPFSSADFFFFFLFCFSFWFHFQFLVRTPCLKNVTRDELEGREVGGVQSGWWSLEFYPGVRKIPLGFHRDCLKAHARSYK